MEAAVDIAAAEADRGGTLRCRQEDAGLGASGSAIGWLGCHSSLAGGPCALVLPIDDPTELTGVGPRTRRAVARHIGSAPTSLGRDVFARALWGARISHGGRCVRHLVRSARGRDAGHARGIHAAAWVDQVISFVFFAILSFPALVLADPHRELVRSQPPAPSSLTLGVLSVAPVGRLARAQTLVYRRARVRPGRPSDRCQEPSHHRQGTPAQRASSRWVPSACSAWASPSWPRAGWPSWVCRSPVRVPARSAGARSSTSPAVSIRDLQNIRPRGVLDHHRDVRHDPGPQLRRRPDPGIHRRARDGVLRRDDVRPTAPPSAISPSASRPRAGSSRPCQRCEHRAREGPDARHRRRVGLGEERHRQDADEPSCPRTAEVEGEVVFEGQDVRQLAAEGKEHFWGVEMTMVFQDPMTSLNPVKKCGEQIAETLRYHMGRSKQEALEEAIDLLGQVGLPDPGQAGASVPPRALRGPSSARRYRDGTRLPALLADRRRAHHRRRRDRAAKPAQPSRPTP